MMTIDVRVLVRHAHTVDEVLDQLLTGVLRVHAVVELPPNDLVASPPVHRNPRSETHHAVARTWSGESLPVSPRPRDAS